MQVDNPFYNEMAPSLTNTSNNTVMTAYYASHKGLPDNVLVHRSLSTSHSIQNQLNESASWIKLKVQIPFGHKYQNQ